MRNLIIILILVLGQFANAEAQHMNWYYGGTYDAWNSLNGRAKALKRNVFIYLRSHGDYQQDAKHDIILNDPQVSSFFNASFISTVIELNDETAPFVINNYQVKNYPAFLFIDNQGNLLKRIPITGILSKEWLIQQAVCVMSNNPCDNWDYYKKAYKNGNRSPDFLAAYIQQRRAETGLPTPYPLMLEYVNAIPVQERFRDHEVRALILKHAAVGNEFYELLKKNYSSFPELEHQMMQINVFSQMLLKVRYESEELGGLAEEMLMKDFQYHAVGGIEFYRIMKLQRSENFIKAYFDFVDKHHLPADFYPMILYHLIQQKDLCRSYAKRGLEFLAEHHDLSTPGYFNYGSYAYFMIRTGRKSEAKEFARQFIAMPWNEVQSKRSTWGFKTLQAIAEGKEPEPFRF
ncbi:hypothetical protein EYV94_25550 [Puteibacter caeruleilacunae]|nr:hypothetical protein EYV94_25550 [Puteibacter caeruleilacunae]